MEKKRVIVVGAGLAGLSAALRLGESGMHVSIVSLGPARRAQSVCAQGGINAAVSVEEGDSPYVHAYETIKGGDFLAEQPPVLEMCLAAPEIVQMLDRLGCPFNRKEDGSLNFRRFGGTLYSRTAFCGSSTGQQLVYTLDEQIRRLEVEGRVERFEQHEFLRLVLDNEGRACGIVLMDVYNLKLGVLKGDAVVMATGGVGALYHRSTNSTAATGAANGRLYLQGMRYANGEFIQIHPTAIFGEDKLRLMSESIRGEGGRIWVYGDASKKLKNSEGKFIQCGETGKPWYFLEELYPAYGNLVPRDIAAREILRITEMGLGAEGGGQVYLDVRHLPEEKLHKVESVLELYAKFTGEDPRKLPMKIFPAVHYSMGGAWVDWPASDAQDREIRFRQMTNLPGCFSVGEASFQYHGANRLGANSLLACIFSGLTAGSEIVNYLNSRTERETTGENCFQVALGQEEEFKKDLLGRSGKESVYELHQQLSQSLMRNVTVKRCNQGLQEALEQIKALRERYKQISLEDRSEVANKTYLFANQFKYMLELALVITKGALLRNESRGAHYKEEYPKRDDQNWLKATIATYDSAKDEPVITYQKIETPYVQPSSRDYTKGNPTDLQLDPLKLKPRR